MKFITTSIKVCSFFFLSLISCNQAEQKGSNEASEVHVQENELDTGDVVVEPTVNTKDEIFIKTAYSELQGEDRDYAEKQLGESDLDKLVVPGNGISQIIMFCMREFIYNPGYGDAGYDLTEPDPVLQYFDDIYLALPDFVSAKERHDGYYSHRSEDFTYRQRIMAYLTYRIDRSPENIKLLWDSNKEESFFWMDKDQLTSLGIETKVNELLSSYAALQKLDSLETKLDSVYLAIDQLNEGKLDSNYAAGAYGTSIYDQGIFFEPLMVGDTTSYSRPLWAYSFWVRRNYEENMEVVADILGEIKERYNSDD